MQGRGRICFNQPLDELCVCLTPVQRKKMDFAAKGVYVSSVPCSPINLPSFQKINTKANVGSLVKWRTGLSGRIAPVCVVFFKELCHDAVRESQK